jgi:hypothetical protein
MSFNTKHVKDVCKINALTFLLLISLHFEKTALHTKRVEKGSYLGPEGSALLDRVVAFLLPAVPYKD